MNLDDLRLTPDDEQDVLEIGKKIIEAVQTTLDTSSVRGCYVAMHALGNLIASFSATVYRNDPEVVDGICTFIESKIRLAFKIEEGREDD